ncbi:hypothetical protein [uncultured Microscilla sp.]|uniref:hypothetical protein n=1 Tax=uncultured Microscilla sp. TaxID=432653 RepID=UPI00261CFEB2|nr:hypothetical protein [uncultured Microscilla sp.]
MAKSQTTPRRFYLFVLGLMGAFIIVFVYCLSITLLANRKAEPLTKSERSIRALGKAYIQFGYYELREFYLTLASKEEQRADLIKETDSLWAHIETNIAQYQKYTILEQPAAITLREMLQAYRQSSLARRKLLESGQFNQALSHLTSNQHQQAFYKQEELFGDMGDLLPYQMQKLLKPEASAYVNGLSGMVSTGWVLIVTSIITLVFIQLAFNAFERKLLVKRTLPLLILINVVVQGIVFFKPSPRFDAKYQLVQDYTLFVNFMSYFNHYTQLEFKHALDSSRLVKKQIEEEMAVYHRSVRQTLRDSQHKLGSRFKNEISQLKKLRKTYFTKQRIPALVYSFNSGELAALRLLMPSGHLSDSILNSLDPESVTYEEGRNARIIREFHHNFDKVLQGLDMYYPRAVQELSQKNPYQGFYWGGIGLCVLGLVWLLWRFRKPKKWALYKAKSHFLVKKQLS